MKYDLNMLLDSYGVPSQAKTIFYEIVNKYAKSPDSVRVEDYGDVINIYYAHQEIWCKLYLFKNSGGYFEIKYREFVDKSDKMILLSADNYTFELGAKNNKEYYAKRITKDGEDINYEALYFDESSLSFVSTQNERDLEYFNSKGFARKGLAPDIKTKIDVLSPEEYKNEIIDNIHMIHDFDEIFNEVNNSITREKRRNYTRTRRMNYVNLNDLLNKKE